MLLAGLVFLTLFTSRPAFFALAAAAILSAQRELYRALAAAGHGPAEPLGLAAGLGMLLGAYYRGPGALSFVLAMSVIATFLWFLADEQRDGAMRGIGATLLGLVWVPFLGAHVTLMRNLPDGPAITISYIGLAALYDVTAYAAGVFFGKHRMAPSVSPKKSWEGAAGATLFVVVLAALVGPHVGPFTLRTALALALVTAVVAPIGDLAESQLKRDLGIKDMGGVLPGHGGVMDRIDSLVLVAPAAYWLVRWLVF